jgi:hypothetical protein
LAFAAGLTVPALAARDAGAQAPSLPRAIGYASDNHNQLVLYQNGDGSLSQCVYTLQGTLSVCYELQAPPHSPVMPMSALHRRPPR